jgi:ADP-ribose pyrophosphatase
MPSIRTEIPFATPWFQVVAKTMREGEAPYYSLRLADYAVTVAMTAEGRFVLVRQYRPAVEKETLELPSGLVDTGEDPAEAARRELYEETGYRAQALEALGPLLPDTGRLGNRIWCFFAADVRRSAEWKEEEGVAVELYDARELAAALAESRFDHALHVAALLLAHLRGLLPDLARRHDTLT